MKKIAQVTNSCIHQIFNNGDLDKGLLANLRNSTSINDRYAAKLWPIIFQAIKENNNNIDDKKDLIRLSRDGNPTNDEIAIYTGLRCYAIFQQAQDKKVFGSCHVDDNSDNYADSFWTALAKLRQQANSETADSVSLDRRVDATLAMTNLPSIINSIVRLERILKGSKLNVRIDFADLANDIYWMGTNRTNARKVALKWGQIYY